MNENRCLLVIDQADQQISSMDEQEKKDLIEFLQQIDDKSFVVIALGKWNEITLGELNLFTVSPSLVR